MVGIVQIIQPISLEQIKYAPYMKNESTVCESQHVWRMLNNIFTIRHKGKELNRIINTKINRSSACSLISKDGFTVTILLVVIKMPPSLVIITLYCCFH